MKSAFACQSCGVLRVHTLKPRSLIDIFSLLLLLLLLLLLSLGQPRMSG